MLSGDHLILGLRITKLFIQLIWLEMDFFTWEIWIEFSVFHAAAFLETGITETVSKENIETTTRFAGNVNKHRVLLVAQNDGE